MKKSVYMSLTIALVLSLSALFSSCTASSELLPIPKLPPKATQGSSSEYDALSIRMSALEKRVENLERELYGNNQGSVVVVPTPTPTRTTTPVPRPNLSDEYEKELHNIQTAVMAMLADSTSGNITNGPVTATTDMHSVQAIDGARMLYLNSYLTGLNGTRVQSGCTYSFAIDGTVTQTKP